MWERCRRGAQTCTHMVFVQDLINNLAYIQYLPPTPTHKHINSVSCTCPLQHTLKPTAALMKMVIVVLPSLFKFNKSLRICS